MRGGSPAQLLLLEAVVILSIVWLACMCAHASSSAKTRELVVAVCKEDLRWIDAVAKDYDKVTVYDKCDVRPAFRAPNVHVQPVPNIGSCDYAFLTYIIDRYDTLPALVRFTKGTRGHVRPIKCTSRPDHVRCANELLEFKLHDWAFTHNRTQEFPFKTTVHDSMRAWVQEDTLLSTDMYEDSACDVVLGGHFAATRDQIRNVSKDVYVNLRAQQFFPNEEVDHYVERSWATMFCTKRQ